MEKEAYHLLQSSDDEVSDLESHAIVKTPRSWKRIFQLLWQSFPSLLGLFCLSASLLLNVVLMRRVTSSGAFVTKLKTYSNLPYDQSVSFMPFNRYWDPSKYTREQMDAEWDAIDTNSIAIAPTLAWAAERGLPPTEPFPWDHDRGTYYVKGFHQLHCVKLIRQAYIFAKEGKEFPVSDNHVFHCLDSLRQDVLCMADDTPMSVDITDQSFAKGQLMQCRSWDRLTAWTQEADRQACYQAFGDYIDIKETLEAFAFCPEGSQYASTVEAYFAKFGHRNLTEIEKTDF